MMTSAEGYQQSYNAQTVCGRGSQPAVGTGVTAGVSDQGQLVERRRYQIVPE